MVQMTWCAISSACSSAAAEEQAERIGDDRERRPRRLLDRQAQCLDEQPGQHDEGQQRQGEVETPVDVQPIGPHDVAPIDGQSEADQGEERGQVEHDLVEQVEIALEELDFEDQLEDIGVERNRARCR